MFRKPHTYTPIPACPCSRIRPRTCADWLECVSFLQTQFAEIGLITNNQEEDYTVLWMMRVLLVPPKLGLHQSNLCQQCCSVLAVTPRPLCHACANTASPARSEMRVRHVFLSWSCWKIPGLPMPTWCRQSASTSSVSLCPIRASGCRGLAGSTASTRSSASWTWVRGWPS